MNIGIVTSWFERGAAYVSRAYHNVLSKEHNVYIFARGGEGYAKNDKNWDNDKVTWAKRYQDNGFRINWYQFKRWIEKNGIELVIFNEQQDWEIVVDCRKLDIKSVAYVDYYTQTTLPFFDLYDAVFCNTKRHYNLFRNHFQPHYIPWGTDVSIFKPENAQKVENQDVVFFHSSGLGGINLRKGTDILVKAFNRIERGAKLIIHSQAPLERYDSVSDMIKNNKNIEFICRTVPAPGLYYLGDIYLYPTRLEGIGLTIAEALASGLPVITTDSAPMNEFIREGITGKLVKVEEFISREDGYYWPESIISEDSLSDAMQYFIRNKEQIGGMKKSAREYAERHLNWNKNAVILNQIVTQVKADPNKALNYNKYKGPALGLSFSRRPNGSCLAKRIPRKLSRMYYGLDSVR